MVLIFRFSTTLRVLVLVLLGACGGAKTPAIDRPPTVTLEEMVAAGAYTLGKEASAPSSGSLRFASPPRVARVASALEWRTAVVTAAGGWSWELEVPPGARLHLGLEAFGEEGADPAPLEISLAVVDGDRRKVLRVISPRELDGPGWTDIELDLGRWEGRRVRCEAEVRPLGPAARSRGATEIAWAPARMTAGSGERPARDTRPDIVLIVVDTLRADALTPYGAADSASPRIDRHLARQGVVFERAYAQAPWTLPSMISLMTGEEPGVVLGREPASFAIPPHRPALPELLSQAGYETGAFIANPTLHHGNGFARGVDDLYIAPADEAFISLQDEILVRKAATWLRSRGERPYFLYVHFLAPHDPYANPMQFLGRSLRHPFYLGRITGRDVHDLFLGTTSLDDPASDVRHLRALYATEVRYVDRRVEELLEALPPRGGAGTLAVFTSDHGEELFDHGGWKHGRTLYEEQLRVPLIFRWEGHIEGRRRVASPVRLVDVAPTLLDAAGLEVRRGGGRSLLPVLRARAEPVESEIFAERLNFGPLVAAVVSGKRKLVLSDVHGRSAPDNKMQERMIEREASRYPRIAVFDLERDPEERRNLAGEAPSLLRRLVPMLHRQLGRTTPGLRVLAGEIPPGSRLAVSLRFERAPAAWRSYFLAAGDRAELAGVELRLDLGADSIEKGVLVLGEPGRIEEVSLHLDGRSVDASRIEVGASSGYAGGPLEADRLTASEAPGEAPAPERPPLLHLWLPHSGLTAPRETPDPETLHRLKALGYV